MYWLEYMYPVPTQLPGTLGTAVGSS
eukprot:SAG31_NODE_24946_length_471_cov_0.916667_1_plen_25_part_01